MNINQYASYLTKREGKKVSVSVAQVQEILKLIRNDFQTWTEGAWPEEWGESPNLFNIVTGKTLAHWVISYFPD